MKRFDLQGHRGARGLKPENTFAGFEVALDAGVTSIETDVHLTRDDVPVLFHDAAISEKLCRLLPKGQAPDPFSRPLVRSLTLAQLHQYRADINADPLRFATQDTVVPPLTLLFVKEHDLDPYAIPTLADLFAFATAYAGRPGRLADKTDEQRAKADQVRFDLELKRIPFRPETIGDNFNGDSPALLEKRVVEIVRQAQLVGRTQVRSFDHRSVRALRKLEPGLTTAVLIAETAPVAPTRLARRAEAQVYCPDYESLDQLQVLQCHGKDIRVVPWTVNEPEEWARLVEWRVDGITTDYPDRLATWLRSRRITF
jgi:glycerophosphoryl diester phosphodiesterase